MERRIDHAALGIEAIDKGLAEAAAITIEQALGHAVLHGTMTAEEAYECLAAYQRTFTDPEAA